MATLDTTPVPDYSGSCRLDSKVFLVFGGGNGIGRQCAHALAAFGAKTVIVGRSEVPTRHVAKELHGLALFGDMSVREDVERVCKETVDRLGRLDGIIDVIALNRSRAFLDMSYEDWIWQLNNILIHAVLGLQIGGPLIAASGGGSVTLIGSIAGFKATLGSVDYGVFKAALHQLTRLAGVQFGPSGVRVNCVAPGLTITPRLMALFGEDKVREMARDYPLGQMPDASDVARAVAFLASDMARNMTCQVITVDGGATMRAPPPAMPELGLV